MASLFLKLGKEKLELAVIDTLMHTFPCSLWVETDTSLFTLSQIIFAL